MAEEKPKKTVSDDCVTMQQCCRRLVCGGFAVIGFLDGLVAKTTAPRARGPGFASHLNPASVRNIGILVDTLPAAWRYMVGAGTGCEHIRTKVHLSCCDSDDQKEPQPQRVSVHGQSCQPRSQTGHRIGKDCGGGG